MKKTTLKIGIFALSALMIVACKKQPAPTLEVELTGDNVYHKNVSVNLKEAWVNYTTKKSNSEWVKLDFKAGIYDFGQLFEKDSVVSVLAPTSIDDAQTFLQLRFIIADTLNQVITQTQDTLNLAISPAGLSGAKVGIAKKMESGQNCKLTLAFSSDTTSIQSATPVFDPKIKIKTVVITP